MIKSFGNTFKLDTEICDFCGKCINECKYKAIDYKENELYIDLKKCLFCKKCLGVCDKHAIYYHITYPINKNKVSISPVDTDYEFNYKYSLGEKIICIEQAFYLERELSNSLETGKKLFTVISDVPNIRKLLMQKEDDNLNLINHLLELNNKYYITTKFASTIHKNSSFDLYGVDFEYKMSLYKYNNVFIYDLPYKSNNTYSIIDMLNVFIEICKFENQKIDSIDVTNPLTINLKNKFLNYNILLCKYSENLSGFNFQKYNLVIFVNENIYISNNRLLKDEEINKIYKEYLKKPLATEYFFK